jgi:hypothetical protein
MRFQLVDEMVAGACAGERISAGIDLQNYSYHVLPLADNFQAALRADLNCS